MKYTYIGTVAELALAFLWERLAEIKQNYPPREA
jgi:hypothetical protein